VATSPHSSSVEPADATPNNVDPAAATPNGVDSVTGDIGNAAEAESHIEAFEKVMNFIEKAVRNPNEKALFNFLNTKVIPVSLDKKTLLVKVKNEDLDTFNRAPNSWLKRALNVTQDIDLKVESADASQGVESTSAQTTSAELHSAHVTEKVAERSKGEVEAIKVAESEPTEKKPDKPNAKKAMSAVESVLQTFPGAKVEETWDIKEGSTHGNASNDAANNTQNNDEGANGQEHQELF
jgi:hypothetical protein